VSAEIIEEIKTEIIVQGIVDSDLKITYIYRPKSNRRVTSCVLEISPVVRRNLMKRSRM